MGIRQNSKIQVRKGLKANLPQLAGGEFGWAMDDQTLWIGNGTIAEGAPFVGNTQILTASSYVGNVTASSGNLTGIQNNINLTFTLPLPALTMPMPGTLLVWNNYPLIPGIGYVQSGTTITFTTAPAPSDSLYYQCLLV